MLLELGDHYGRAVESEEVDLSFIIANGVWKITACLRALKPKGKRLVRRSIPDDDSASWVHDAVQMVLRLRATTWI